MKGTIFNKSDLKFYNPPEKKEMLDKGISRNYFMNYFIKWILKKIIIIAQKILA